LNASDPPASRPDIAALAVLAFGPGASIAATGAITRHLAYLPIEALELDLSDPEQRDFGDYELLERLGSGGMGVVYRARQKSLDREVAVKLLSAGPWASADFIERFRREAQSAARLEHPNIVAIHEIGSCDELNYFSMALVRGPNLALQLERDGPLPARQAAQLMRTIAEALHYAHRLGVLHLDLKPGNILIDENGYPLIADFGLARRIGIATDDGAIAGTPGYMAPEQAIAGYPLDQAADIWGLGAILHEVLCGRPPGGDLDTTLAGVPADLRAICRRCLAQAPSQRYASARELADELGRFLDGRAVQARPLGVMQRLLRWARREPKLVSALALGVTALLTGTFATALQWRRAEANASTATARLLESRREAALRETIDGKAYSAMPHLLQNIASEERSGDEEGARADRLRLGMLQAQGAVLIDAIGIADSNPLAVAVSPDGSRIAIALGDQSVRWYDSADLHELGRVSLAELASSDGEERAPVLLRFIGEHRLLVTREWYGNLVSPYNGDSWLIDLRRMALVPPPAAFADFASACYAGDGRHALLFAQDRSRQLWRTDPWQPVGPRVSAGEDRLMDFPPCLFGPDARYLATLRVTMRELEFFPRGDLTRPKSRRFPGDAGISAWATSHDGHWIALGDFEGRAFLLDTRDASVRILPTSRGREATWVAFSEDDAWLAVATADGNAYAFDVARGDSLVTGGMHHDFLLRRVGISHARRMLVAAGEGATALWRIPDGSSAIAAQRIGAAPAPHGLAAGYPSDWSFTSGLLASAGIDGQVRLWRLPISSLSETRQAFQLPERVAFDGRQLVDVVWNRLRVVSTTGQARTPWLELAQPPGFAELTGDGRSLVACVGTQLQVFRFDAGSLRLRYPPVPLPETPQRFLISADGQRLLLGFGRHGAGGFEDELHLYRLADGARLPGSASLPGPARLLAFSADGERLLVVGPTEGATTVLRTRGLQRIGEYPHDPFQPVTWADFAGDGRNVIMVLRADDPRMGDDAVLEWDPARDTTGTPLPTGRARPVGLVRSGDGAFITGNLQDLLYRPGAGIVAVARTTATEATAVTAALATSADGRIVAHAFHHSVQLHLARNGDPLGAPLQADISALDFIARLAFSPDDRILLARSVYGRTLVWPLTTDPRPVRAVAASLDRLDADREDQQRVAMPGPAIRRAMRAADPGAWMPRSPRPPLPGGFILPLDGATIPERTPAASPLQLDLNPHYSLGPDSMRNSFYNLLPSIRPFPVGVLRYAGIDYDVRGASESGRTGEEGRAPFLLRCVEVPPTPIAALHPLMFSISRAPTAAVEPRAQLVLHYRDGSQARVLLRTGRELPGYGGRDAGVPVVFGGVTELQWQGYPRDAQLVAPRLANPHPQRPVRCIDLTPFGHEEPILVFAITVEPTAPVIAGAVPGIGAGESREAAGRQHPIQRRSTP
jgi:WD40 repeat protein